MADIVLVAAGNGTAANAWSTCNSGSPPAAGDLIYLSNNGCILALDGGDGATYTCASIRARTTGGGYTSGSINHNNYTNYTLACDLYGGSVGTTLLTNPAGKNIISIGKIYGGHATTAGVVAGAGTIGSITGCYGGTASSSMALFVTGTVGSIGECIASNYLCASVSANITTGVTLARGGSGTNAHGIRVGGGFKIASITTAEGGSGTGACGVRGDYGNIGDVGTATGGSGTNAYGVTISGSSVYRLDTVTTAQGGIGPGAHGVYVDVAYTCKGIGTAIGGGNATAYGVLCRGTLTNGVTTAKGGTVAGAHGVVVYGHTSTVDISNLDFSGFATPVGLDKVRLPANAQFAVRTSAGAEMPCIEEASIVAAENVVSGVARYPLGGNGTYPTSESVIADVMSYTNSVLEANKASILNSYTFTYGPPYEQYDVQGTYDASLYVEKTAVAPVDVIVSGFLRWVGGTEYGIYPTTETSKAEQLIADTAEVEANKSSIKDDTTILTIAGTYDFQGAIDSAVDAQRSSDEAEVVPYAPVIIVGNTILGTDGTHPTAATSKAEQLAEDEAVVESNKNGILTTTTILGVAGTFDVDEYEAARNTNPGEENVRLGVTWLYLGDQQIGELDVSQWIPISDIVAAEHVEQGYYNYVGGEAGTFTHKPEYTLISGVVAPEYVLVGHHNYQGGEEGEFDEQARNTNPGQQNVLANISYKVWGVSYSGGLVYTIPSPVPPTPLPPGGWETFSPATPVAPSMNFPRLADIDNAYRMLKNMGDWYYPEITYKELIIPDRAEIDDIHLEASETRKRFKLPIKVRAYIHPDPVTQSLTNFGLEERRNVTMSMTVPHMIDAGLATRDVKTGEISVLAKIGDRFWHSESVQYDVLEVKRSKMFGLTDIPLTFDFVAERFRLESTPYEGV